MPAVAHILSRLASKTGQAAGWDVSGLQLGDPDAEVGSLGVCHEVTEEVVAAAEGLDLLVTYHPLLFRPTTRITSGRSPEGRAYRLVRAGVALAVAHTSFDVAPGGAADALATALGLRRLRGFAPVVPPDTVKVVTFVPPEAVEPVTTAMSEAGGGVIGNYSGCSFRTRGVGAFLPGEGADPTSGRVGGPAREEEVRVEMVASGARADAVVAAMVRVHPYEEPAYDVYEVRSNMGMAGRVGSLDPPPSLGRLAARVSEILGGEGLRVSGDPDLQVATLAVLPGSGSSLLPAAVASGADAFLTGDVGHHRVVEALDRSVAVLDPGHAASERPGMSALVRMVQESAGDAEVVDLAHIDPTPWR